MLSCYPVGLRPFVPPPHTDRASMPNGGSGDANGDTMYYNSPGQDPKLPNPWAILNSLQHQLKQQTERFDAVQEQLSNMSNQHKTELAIVHSRLNALSR